MSKAKVTFHVKKLQQSLPVADTIDATIGIVVERLLHDYKEYQFEPKAELRSTVGEVLAELENGQSIKAQHTGVVSLNQTMINNFNRSSSKRQRPAELKEMVGMNAEAAADSENNTTVSLDANLSENQYGEMSSKVAKLTKGSTPGSGGSVRRKKTAIATAASASRSLISNIQVILVYNSTKTLNDSRVAADIHLLTGNTT
jgi:hypothetical protein